MKRMIIALVLLGIIICTAFVTSDLARNAIDKTCVALNDCIQKKGNETLYPFKIRDAVSVWNRNKKIIYAVMFHEDFSEIEKCMAELEYQSRHNDFSRSSQICAEIELLLINKKEETNISFENIF